MLLEKSESATINILLYTTNKDKPCHVFDHPVDLTSDSSEFFSNKLILILSSPISLATVHVVYEFELSGICIYQFSRCNYEVYKQTTHHLQGAFGSSTRKEVELRMQVGRDGRVGSWELGVGSRVRALDSSGLPISVNQANRS